MEIVADLSKFGRELERGLNRELRDVDVDASPLADQLAFDLGEAVDGMAKTLGQLPAQAKPGFEAVADEAEDMADQIERELGQVDRKIETVQRSIRELAREFARTGDQNVFDSLRGEKVALANLRAVRGVIDEIGDEARESARELDEMGDQAAQAGRKGGGALGALSGVLSAVTKGLGSVGAAVPNPASLGLFAVALGGIALAVPAVLALGAALFDLVGLLPLLPAAAGVAGAAMLTLQIALFGVGDAIKAVIKGDPKKIAEAMEKLGPAARGFVKEFQRVLPQLRAFQRLIAANFFAPLEGALTRFVRQSLPTLRKGMGGIATQIGQLVATVVAQLGGPQAMGFFSDVFATAHTLVDRVTGSVDSLLNIVFRLGNAGLPLINQFVDFLLDGADSLSAFLSSAEGQTALQDFLDDAVATLKDLWDLVKAGGDFLAALFGGADDEGRNFIQTLTGIVTAMAEFLRSAQGQEFLQNLLDLMPLLTVALQQFVIAVGATIMWVNILMRIFDGLAWFFTNLPGWIATAATAIGGWFVSAWQVASSAVDTFFTTLGTWFANLGGLIGGWLAAAGAALWAALQMQWDGAIAIVSGALTVIVAYVTQLPGLIVSALMSLGGMLAGLFGAAWGNARNITMTVLNAIVAFAGATVGRIIGALLSLGGRLRAMFASALSAARATVVSGFNSIVSVASSAAGRLAGLAGRFMSAGRGIITGFFNGLRATGGMASNVGSAIVSAVRGGLNSVIGSINAGIGAIDARLPGSLPRIPSVAVGGLTVADGLAQLHNRELVLPLEDRRATDLLARAMAAAAEQGRARGGDGAALADGGEINIRVYLGTREITDVVNVVVDERDRELRRRVTAGPGQR